MFDLSHNTFRSAGVRSAAWMHTPAQLGEGLVWAVGPYGDKDPGQVFDRARIRVTGTKPIYVAPTLSEVLSGTDRISIAASAELPIEGEHDALYIYNPNGSGGGADFFLQARRLAIRNSKSWGHPGNGEFVVRATPVNNATTVYTAYARAPITLSYVKTWTKAPASGAACSLAVAGPSGNLLSAATVDVTALTTVTYQSQTLTATTSRLNLDPGHAVTLTVVGANGLTPGDLLVALGWSFR